MMEKGNLLEAAVCQDKTLSLKEISMRGGVVEYKPLWEVTIWDKRFNSVPKYKQEQVEKYQYFLAKDLREIVEENGDIKILTTSPSCLYTTKYKVGQKFSTGEIVAIPWGGNPIVQYYSGEFVTSDNRIAKVKDTEILNTKYLYYYLLNNIGIISGFYRGSGIKHPDMAKVLDLKIPIPPLAEQQRIVGVLDRFTELSCELLKRLEQEQIQRRRQYEYYRDKLLDFGDVSMRGGVEWKPLGEVATIYGGLTGKSKSDFENGNASYISYKNIFDNIEIDFNNLQKVKVSHSEKQHHVRYGDILFTGSSETVDEAGISSAVTTKCNEPVYLNSFSFGVRFNEDIQLLPEFSKYLLRTYFMRKQIIKTASGVTRFNISKKRFAEIQIPLPPLSEQMRIVGILDKFDTLVNSLDQGLPKEIALHQKQYEYYRGKLLSFAEPATTLPSKLI